MQIGLSSLDHSASLTKSMHCVRVKNYFLHFAVDALNVDDVL